MIAGASVDVAAVSYSGPGPVLGRERYQHAIEAACPSCDTRLGSAKLAASSLNFAPAADPRCDSGIEQCHSISRTICTLVIQCGNTLSGCFVNVRGESYRTDVESCCVTRNDAYPWLVQRQKKLNPSQFLWHHYIVPKLLSCHARLGKGITASCAGDGGDDNREWHPRPAALATLEPPTLPGVQTTDPRPD